MSSIDEIYWDAHEELLIEWNMPPTYEEVMEYLKEKFKLTSREHRNRIIKEKKDDNPNRAKKPKKTI